MKKLKNYNTDAVTSLVASEPMALYFQHPLDLIRISRKGVVKKALLQLANKLSMTMKELAAIIHISERTLQRYDDKDILAPDITERALLLSGLYQEGIKVFGNPDSFNDWLRTPLPAFEQKPPIEYLDTSFGFGLIMDELGRISHGIFA